MSPDLYAVLSTIKGPDGNGVLSPFDPPAGGIGGGTQTSDNNNHLCTGAYTPPDNQSTDIEAIVIANQGVTGAAPVAVWRARIGITAVRSGNTVTIHGPATSCDVRSSPSLASLSAKWTVDTSVTPNTLAVQVKGVNGPPSVTWSWRAQSPYSLANL